MSENTDSVALESQTLTSKSVKKTAPKKRKTSTRRKTTKNTRNSGQKTTISTPKTSRGNTLPKISPEKMVETVLKSPEKPEIYQGMAMATLGENWGLPVDETEVTISPEKVQRLPANVKQFMVCYFACGSTPTEVMTAVKEAFGLTLKQSNVIRYDPMRQSGQTLSVELKKLYRTVQREYQQMVVKAGVGDKRYRMQKLQLIVQSQMDKGNHPLAMKAMEQAAKEVGDAYTNKSTLQIEDKRVLMAKLLKCRPEDIPTLQQDAAQTREKVGSTKRW